MEKTQLSKADIKRACDILRMDDGVGANNYIEQLSWLLFLKVLENIEEELRDLAEGKYEDIIEPEYKWSKWAKKDWKDKDELVYFINQKLFPYLRNLKGTPEKEKVSEIFREITNRIHSSHTLLDTIDILDQINMAHFQDTHLLSQVYEEILQEMGSEGGWSGEFYTPRPIIRLMIKIIKPKIGEVVLDPFVGSGGFLIESFNYIQETNPKMGVKEWETLQRKTFYGQEKKPLPYLIGMMNLILHRILVPNIVRTNTLMEDIHNMPESQKTDVIFTNPPFGGKENKSVQENFPIPMSATEGLALQYVMRRLKNGGRCGIILPEGQILFGGGAFQAIREELLQKFNVTTIISLPTGAFAQMGAGVKTNLIFFEKTGPTKQIWYGEVKGRFTKKKNIQFKDFEDIYSKWQNKEISDDSWFVDIEDISKNNYDLSAINPVAIGKDKNLTTKLLINSIDEETIQINKIEKELKKELDDFPTLENNNKVRMFKLEELASFSNGYAFKSGDFNDDNGYIVIKMGNVTKEGKLEVKQNCKYISYEKTKGLENFILKDGDIVITMTDVSRERRLIGHTAIIDTDKKYILNQRVGKIIPNKDIVNTNYLHLYTNSSVFIEYIKKNSSGVLQFNTSTRAIRNALIPIPILNGKPDLEEQQKIVDKLVKARLLLDNLKNKYDKQQLSIGNLNTILLRETFLTK